MQDIFEYEWPQELPLSDSLINPRIRRCALFKSLNSRYILEQTLCDWLQIEVASLHEALPYLKRRFLCGDEKDWLLSARLISPVVAASCDLSAVESTEFFTQLLDNDTEKFDIKKRLPESVREAARELRLHLSRVRHAQHEQEAAIDEKIREYIHPSTSTLITIASSSATTSISAAEDSLSSSAATVTAITSGAAAVHVCASIPSSSSVWGGARRRKAMKSAREYNANVMQERRRERVHYWDLQTMQIHVPHTQHLEQPIKRTRQSEYPVALLPNQFAEFPFVGKTGGEGDSAAVQQHYTAELLRRLPLNRASLWPISSNNNNGGGGISAELPSNSSSSTASSHLFNLLGSTTTATTNHQSANHNLLYNTNSNSFTASSSTANQRGGRAGSVSASANATFFIDESSTLSATDVMAELINDNSMNSMSTSALSSSGGGGNGAASSGGMGGFGGGRTASAIAAASSVSVEARLQALRDHCRVCEQPIHAANHHHHQQDIAQQPIICSECNRPSHVKCLELPDDLIARIRNYKWSCMDCKKCVECASSDTEEFLMFCDFCDRGYHSFCVGLKEIPDGSWTCALCNKASH